MRRNRPQKRTLFLAASLAHAQSLPWPFFAWTREYQPEPTFRPQFATTKYQTQPFIPSLDHENSNWNQHWPEAALLHPTITPSTLTYPSQTGTGFRATANERTQLSIVHSNAATYNPTHYPASRPAPMYTTQTTTNTRITESGDVAMGIIAPVFKSRSTDYVPVTPDEIHESEAQTQTTTTTTAYTMTFATNYSSSLIPGDITLASEKSTRDALVKTPAEINSSEGKDSQENAVSDLADNYANVPYYSGLLPESYFDQATTSSTSPPIDRGDKAVYRPYNYNITELLVNPAPDLSPYVRKPNEINIYCYPFEESEILGKCREGLSKQEATGVLLPLMNEIQSPKSARYYDNVRRLKNEKNAKGEPIRIYGVAYDNPAWDVITQILTDHQQLFDGLVLEWVGSKACVWNMKSPTRAQVDVIAQTAGLPIQYFARQQDCDPYLLSKSGNGGSFFNPNDVVDINDLTVTKGVWPKFLRYIFPCFQGEEGPCYHAIRNHPEKVCSSELQKFAYSPFEALGGLMMYLKNETCHGLGDHDLYSVI